MSDLYFVLTAVAAAASLYTLFTLRGCARRLHYRDRALFWRAVAGLLAGILGVILLLGAALWPGSDRAWALYAGGALAVALAGAAWWVDLEPRRVLAVRAGKGAATRR